MDVHVHDGVRELNRNVDWFRKDDRDRDGGPFVIVVDGFYADPEGVRSTALRETFTPYSPPSADQVGADVAAAFAGRPPAWHATVFKIFRGERIANPVEGYRYDPDQLRRRMCAVVGEHVLPDAWAAGGGDGWNGAFHYQNANWTGRKSAVHHHWKAGDVERRGFSGVVYLSLDAPPAAGTSIWRSKATGKCVGAYGPFFDYDTSKYELALLVENVFNRLVLFREAVLHRAEHGFGNGKADARLTQTFFFATER